MAASLAACSLRRSVSSPRMTAMPAGATMSGCCTELINAEIGLPGCTAFWNSCSCCARLLVALLVLAAHSKAYLGQPCYKVDMPVAGERGSLARREARCDGNRAVCPAQRQGYILEQCQRKKAWSTMLCNKGRSCGLGVSICFTNSRMSSESSRWGGNSY